jgi:hypothetical protein
MLGAAPVSLSKGIIVGAADGNVAVAAVAVGLVDAVVSVIAVVSVVIVIVRKTS